MSGNINDARVWNKALTSSEITAAMNTELNGNENGLVAYYKLDETSGTAIADSSSNGNNGTLYGGTLTPTTQVMDDSNLAYALGSDYNGSLFDINSTTGLLTFTSNPDYETTQHYEVNASVTDGFYTVYKLFDINLSNVNEATLFTSLDGNATATFSVSENTTSLLTLTASDTEGDDLNFSISGGADATSFDINATSGELTFKVPADYESGTINYEVVVMVSDGNGGSATQSITVNIIDVDESQNGVCGTSDGGSFTTAPSSNLCSVGTATAVSTEVSTYTWSCEGTTVGVHTGVADHCSAIRTVASSSSSSVASSGSSSSATSSVSSSSSVAISSAASSSSELSSSSSSTSSVASSSSSETTLSLSNGSGDTTEIIYTHEATIGGGSSSTSVVSSLTITPTGQPAGAPQSILSEAIEIDATSSVAGFTQKIVFSLAGTTEKVFVGFWKYGPTVANTSDHWYDFGTLSANTADTNKEGTGYEISNGGKTLTIYLVDNKDGDDDSTAGVIHDPGFPIIRAASAVAAPLFGPLGTLLIMLLMGLLGYRKLQ